MKQYIPHVLLVIGILIFLNGLVMFAYSGSVIPAIIPIIGAGMAIYLFQRLRNSSIPR
jgi:hypothetical protein